MAEILHQFLGQSYVELGMDNRILKYYARDFFESFVRYNPNLTNATSVQYGFNTWRKVRIESELDTRKE